MKDKYTKLLAKLNSDSIKIDEPLKNHTTLKIGGPADILFSPTSTEELIEGVTLARELETPITMLGWGSNVLVSDKGIRGLVIRNKAKNIIIHSLDDTDKVIVESTDQAEQEQARWDSATEDQGGRTMYNFKEVFYEEEAEIVQVEVDSGVDLPFFINKMIREEKLTGLQWYGRIPGTIGGAIYNNIHGGTQFISELIDTVTILNEKNEIQTLSQKQLEIGYDKSRFHNTKEIILSAVFNLQKGDVEKAWEAYQNWTRSKAALQPPVSCGSIFQTISNEEKEKRGWPSGSAGYIIEHQLKMTGFHIGDAWISDDGKKHHNFIENKGNASAQEYLAVIKEVQKKAKNQLNLDLQLEIFLLGDFR